MEAAACKKVVRELLSVADKLQRKVEREQKARQSELETVMEYASEMEIQDAYGYGCLTEEQYQRYLDLFHIGQDALDNHAPTVTEVSLRITRRILSDIHAEQQEWSFAALTPEEQQAEMERAEQSAQSWKKRIAEIKQQRGLISPEGAETERMEKQ